MNNYQNLVENAKILLKNTQNFYQTGNRMAYFMLLHGIGAGLVESAPGVGHNYLAVLDAIHEYQRENPNLKVKEGFYEGLDLMADKAHTQETFKFVFDYINYELKKEKDGSASFQIDCASILRKLKSSLERELPYLKSQNANFDAWLKHERDALETNHGQKFWFVR